MARYEDYVQAVDDLAAAITAADHASADARRQHQAMLESLEREHEMQVERAQERARKSAADYLRAARMLETGTAQTLGIRLPDRVRPVSSKLSAAIALRAQADAATSLANAIEVLEARARADLESASQAAAALAARQAAMAQKPEPEPTPADKPKAARLPAKLPLLPLACATALASIGFLATTSVPVSIAGLAVGAGLGLLVAWLPSRRRP